MIKLFFAGISLFYPFSMPPTNTSPHPPATEKVFAVTASELTDDKDLVLVWRDSVVKEGSSPDLSNAHDDPDCATVAWKVIHMVANFDNELRMRFTDQVGVSLLQQSQKDHNKFAFPRVSTKIYPGDRFNIIRNRRGSFTWEKQAEDKDKPKGKEDKQMSFFNATNSYLDIGYGFYTTEEMTLTTVQQRVGVNRSIPVHLPPVLCAYVVETGLVDDGQLLSPTFLEKPPLWQANIFSLPFSFGLRVENGDDGSFSISMIDRVLD